MVGALGVGALALGTVACGESEKSSSSASTAAAATTIAAPSGAFDSSGSPAATAPTAALTAARQLIVTAAINVEVSDVAKASSAVITLVEASGGELFGQQSESGPPATATLVVKVPPTGVLAALDGLAKLGKERQRTLKADDVTGQIVDLESRISTAEVSVDRLRTFLGKAISTSEVASLEGELTNRETELEQLRGQKRTIDAQVAMATITVSLTTPVAHKDPVKDLPGVGPALRGGLHALWYTARVIAVVVLAAAPLTVAGLILAFAGWRLWRRSRRRRSTPSNPVAPERELVDDPS